MKRILTVLILAVVMLALPISGAFASESVHVSGTTGWNPFLMIEAYANPELAKLAGKSGNVIAEVVGIEDAWVGDITCTSNPTTGRFVFRNWSGMPGDCNHPLGFCPDTQITAHMKLTFTNPTILGQYYTGTLTMELNILAIGSGLEGHWTILYGSGELVNLHGHGTVAIEGPVHSYDGQIHFDP